MSVHEQKKLAIIHFEVEFVTSVWEAPPWVQKPQSTDPEKKEERDARANKFTVKEIRYPDGFQKQLADELYAILVSELEKRTREVLPVEAIRSSEAYQLLNTFDAARTVLLEQSQRLDPDVANPKSLWVTPGGGLAIVYGSQDLPIEEAAIDLLRELDADVAAAVRLRIGVYRERATIEAGSKVWILSRNAFGSASLVRTVMSEEPVLIPDEFKVVRRNLYAVNGDAYRAAMQHLFPNVIAAGFRANREPPPATK